MTTYRIPGEWEKGVTSALPVSDLSITVRSAVRVAPTLRDGAPAVDLDVADDDVLEVELENGFVLWTTMDQLLSDANTAGVNDRGDSQFPLRYPLQQRGTQRGAVSDVIRSVRVLGFDIPRTVAQIAADKIESRLAGMGRFFRIDAQGELTPEDPPATAPDEPTLVLIHGTFSSTLGGFSGFFDTNNDIWRQLHQHYRGRVYGFDHRTLTADPVENALKFLEAIPSDANLHLVSHSRGGLVADLIAHGQVTGSAFAEEDLVRELERAFGKKKEQRDEQLERYREFNRKLAEKTPRVTRYVRVGCPAAGTTLASGRLDIYLSILINLLKKVPAAGPLLGGLGEFVAAVAKERTKADSLPGLEAQMPRSAFIRLLNGSTHVLDTDLTVIAGDSDGFLKNLANLFYWRANDLVVDTRSMYGGAPRASRLWHLEENRHVTHMNYFSRPETARIVQRGLTRVDGDDAGFHARRPRGAVRGHVPAGKPDERTDRAGVILLPGIMGSNLVVVDGNKRDTVWLDKTDILRGRGEKLAMGGPHTVEPYSVLDSPYEAFRDDLVRHDLHVMPVAYDWRRSLTEAVTLLNAMIRARLIASDQPLHLVAHSMGGLVASLLIAHERDTWDQLRDSGGRLVQVGTPNRGSYVIPRILQGEESVVRMIAALDLKNELDTWLGWIARFPGLLELAPSFGGLDFSRIQTWKALNVRRLGMPSAADLRSTQVVRQALSAQTALLAGEGVLYVAGGPEPTPVYDASANGLRFTERGDGRVSWESGIPPGAPTWYIPAAHGSLLDTKSAFDGLRELIVTGDTDRLATNAPAASNVLRGEPLEVPILSGANPEPDFVPSQEDLEAAALGMAPAFLATEASVPTLPPCRVSVVHADLRFCDSPIMVGHYRGDQIVHAESVLDECVDGALSSRYQLGVYPDEIGTTEVVLRRQNPGRKHPGPTGAIVLGLGNVGELSPGGLTRALETGLLRYAQAVVERGLSTSNLTVSALLIGSGETGVTTQQSVAAVVRAIENANSALSKLRNGAGGIGDEESGGSAVRITQLDLIELYEDVALEALHALVAMPPSRNVEVDRQLARRTGGERRSRATNAPRWWSPVQISSSRPNRSEEDTSDECAQQLTFTAYGRRARAEVGQVYMQRALVEAMIADAMRGQAGHGGDLPKALFELLVPPEFKAASGNRHRLKLLLDSGSAAYPWELLIDRKLDRSEPMGIGSGVLRQLKVENVQNVVHPEENRILIIGDPPSDMPALPAAENEARALRELFRLRDGWDVESQIRGDEPPPTVGSITTSLTTKDYRILHLAGHGVYDAEKPWCSGMVIGGNHETECGHVLISPQEVRQLRMQPELVFINCCHLGLIEHTPVHKLASNLAAAFIQAGVKAVVAAGWPVEDQAAKDFCIEFYRRMLDGEEFGEAVLAARARIYDYPSNTWGAFQCYGDPGFRLLMDATARSRASGTNARVDDVLTVTELAVELDNLVQRARVRNKKEDRSRIETRCDALWDHAERQSWLETTGVLIGFARLAGELGDFQRAVVLFKRGVELDHSGATVEDLERYANYRVRIGGQRRISAAIADLKRLVRYYGKNAERLSLIGSAYKGLVLLSANRQQLGARSAEMVKSYVDATELSSGKQYYPATNALLGIVLFGGPWTRPPRSGSAAEAIFGATKWGERATFDEQLAAVQSSVRASPIESFADAASVPDLQVVSALREGTLGAERTAIARQYRSIMAQYGADREIHSVVKQLGFAQWVSRTLGRNTVAKDLQALLEALDKP